MRTTLNIDTDALRDALAVAPGQTKTEVINAALRAFAQRKLRKGLLDWRGKVDWEGDIDTLRQRG